MSSKLRKILKYIFALLLWRPLCIGLGSRYCYEGWHRAVITIYRDVPTKRVTIFTKASVVKDRLFALFDRCGVFLKCYAFLFIITFDWQFWLFIRDEWIACFLRVEKWTFVFLCGRCRCQALVYKQQTKKYTAIYQHFEFLLPDPPNILLWQIFISYFRKGTSPLQ